jgi:hypothetical protein
MTPNFAQSLAHVAAAALKAKRTQEMRSRWQKTVKHAGETFDDLDSDKNGTLNQIELAVLAKKLGQRWAHKDLRRYFNHLIRLQALHMLHNDMGNQRGMAVASGNVSCIHVGGLDATLQDEAAVTKLFSTFGTVVRSPLTAGSCHGGVERARL